MSQEEVHAILGGPPGDYRTRLAKSPGPFTNGSGEPWLIEVWKGDEGNVLVDYNPPESGEDGVWVAKFYEAESHPSLFDRVLWRLERLKERWLP
jgi:hypothetical protein